MSTLLRLGPFNGIVPRTGIRLLADSFAQRAQNVKLQSGELRPLQGLNLQLTTPVNSPKTNPATTLFKARSGSTSSSWFTWPIDVDCVRVPLATDVESRFCWTGDGPPKMCTYTNAISGSGDNYPLLANELMLGIPFPQTIPAVTGTPAVCTISIATPGVVTVANSFSAGNTVVFSTTGALPTGLTPGTTYYVIATGLTTSSFQVSATSGGTAINTSGAQSGVHTVTGLQATGGTGTATSRYYCYTFQSALGEESAPSPISLLTSGKLDSTWTITLPDAAPVNSGVANGIFSSDTLITNTENSAKSIASSTNATPIVVTTSASHGYATGDKVVIKGHTTNTAANNTYANPYWTLTVLSPTTYSLTGSVGVGIGGATGTSDRIKYTWLRPGELVTINSVSMAVATTPTAYTFTVASNQSAYTTWSRTTNWNTSGLYKNLYRTAGSLGSFQLVATSIPAATTTYTDTLTDVQILGDALLTSGWVLPPVNLAGLSVHPSGALCGFVNNLLCFSEPLQPHAWPVSYKLSSGYNGVGIGIYGTTVVMATQGPPFIASGVEPASMTGEDVQGMYPCLSKRSVVSLGDSVLYASKYGMVQVGNGGVGIYTDKFYTRDEWELLNPSTMFSERANGRLYIGYGDSRGFNQILIFDGETHTTSTAIVSELYADPATGDLYTSGASGIYLWDSPLEVVLFGSWRSKEYVFPAPVSLGAGKIDFTLAVSADLAAAILAQIAAATVINTALLAAKVVTTPIATPGIVNWANNTLKVNDPVVFQVTGGVLPTGLVAGTTYYVKTITTAGAAFTVSATAGGTVINFTGTSTGAQTSISMREAGGSINRRQVGVGIINGSLLANTPVAPASNEITLNIYSGTTLIASRVVSDKNAFRLPAGSKRDNFSFEVVTQCRVSDVRIAETMDGLRVG